MKNPQAMKLEKKIVLVAGANGRIGTEVMRRLTGHFSDVVGFDRKAPSLADHKRTASFRAQAIAAHGGEEVACPAGCAARAGQLNAAYAGLAVQGASIGKAS